MDLNGDGYVDILSGSWPGELFLFEGGPDHTFAGRKMIADKNGEIINIGGGIEPWSEGGILIRGHAEFERTDKGSVAIYRGKRYESTPERRVVTTGTASTACAVDWDHDGDCDLIVGDIQGNVYLIPNEGTATAYAFGEAHPLEAEGQSLRVQSRAGPHAADWDGDGDLDLIVGADDGSVSLFRNVGSAKEPELAAATPLVPPVKRGPNRSIPEEARRGGRSKVCVADWNGDGRADLLVGDFARQKPDLPEPTPEERAKHDRIRQELEPLQKRYSELRRKLRELPQEERHEVETERQEIYERMSALRAKLPKEYEYHGWVWLFLRKP